MKITFWKNKNLEDYIYHVLFYRKTGETAGQVTYQGIFEFVVGRQSIELNSRQFAKFFREVRVENGRKKKIGDAMAILPLRNKLIRVKVPRVCLSGLNKVAKHYGRKLATHARFVVLDALREGLEAVGWPGRELKPKHWRLEREKLKPATILHVRISQEQYELLTQFVKSVGENISRFVRRNLIFDAQRTLAVLERLQTSGLLGGPLRVRSRFGIKRQKENP